jgi:hypothetical protein
MFVDLDADEPFPISTEITMGFRWEDFAISADGVRMGVLERRSLAVYDLDTRKQLTAARLGDDVNPIAVTFDDRQSIRILASSREGGSGGDPRWWIYWLNVDERSLSTGIEIETPWRWQQRSRDGKPDNPLAWIQTEDGRYKVVIRDPATGVTIRDLGSPSYWSDLRLMNDGRIVVIRDRDDEHHLDVFASNGEFRHRVDLPVAEEIYHGGEVEPDRVLVGLWTWEGEPPNRRAKLQTVSVDLSEGTSEKLLIEYAPVLGTWRVRRSTGSGSVGSMAGRLVQGEDRSLHLWDPETNALTQLIPVPD